MSFILNLTEDKMTDLLLKNKKLVNNEIILFDYNNEVFSNEINDLISNFKYPDRQNLSIDDKVILYNYIFNNPGNDAKYQSIINNFITLIEYINKNKDNKINKETKISQIEIVQKGQNISVDFQSIFKPDDNKDEKEKADNKKDKKDKKDDLIVNKLPNMLNYFLEIIFKYIKKDIEKYQQKKEDKKEKDNLDEELIKNLDKIFNKNDMVIKKESLASAIRIFISLVLYREKENDKERKIKSNRKNIIDYLKAKDLWETNIYNNSQFEENLERIKSLNIKIQEILWFYYYLVDNKDEGFENEVEEHIRKIKEKEEEERKEREKQEKEERERENMQKGQIQLKKKEKKDKKKKRPPKKKKRKGSDSDSDSGSGSGSDSGSDSSSNSGSESD